MSDYICFLITFVRIIPYDLEAGEASELIKVALKVHRDDLPRPDAAEYPRECEANLRLLLPKHCRDLGPIVDIEVIAEVEDTRPKADLYLDFINNPTSGMMPQICAKADNGKEVTITESDLHHRLLALWGFMR